MHLFSSFFLDTLSFCIPVLWPFSDSKHCTYISFIYMMMLLLFHLSLHVLFFFSLFIHMFLIMYAIFYFCFTLRCLEEFCLKYFRKTGCQNLSCHELFSCKVFQEFVLRIRFYCIQQVIMSWVIYDFSHISFVCCGFVTDCQRGRLLGHMWNVLRTYVI